MYHLHRALTPTSGYVLEVPTSVIVMLYRRLVGSVGCVNLEYPILEYLILDVPTSGTSKMA